MAVNRVTLMPKNPLSGLNAIGGAVSLDVKNGFNYRCEEAEVRGRSFGRAGVDAQAGVQKGNYSAYMTADSIHDDGWRDFSSSSELNGIYPDLGACGGDQTESRLQFTGAIDNLGAVAAPPEHCSSSVGRPSIPGRRPRIFSWLSSKRPAVGSPTDTFSMQRISYYRGFWQGHVDGNGTNGQPCDPSGPLAVHRRRVAPSISIT